MRTQERSARGKFANRIVCGRAFCIDCKRWRHVVDFSPRTWHDAEKTVIRSVQSRCRVCGYRYIAAKRANPTPAQRRRMLATGRAWARRKRRLERRPEQGARVIATPKPDSLRREPFAEWLRERLSTGMSMRELADRTKLNERQIRTFLSGYDKSGSHKRANRKSKLRQVDWISFTTVDRALHEYGDLGALDRLYPLSEDDL